MVPLPGRGTDDASEATSDKHCRAAWYAQVDTLNTGARRYGDDLVERSLVGAT
jgi:hypothetical protein